VPTAYLEILPQSSALPTPTTARPASSRSESTTSITSIQPGVKKQGPAVAPKRGAKKVKHVEAMYAYEASGEGEFDMSDGERFILIDMGSDGWAEVERGGERGVVPASYVREV
jgi:formin-binding protein 1